MEDKVHIRPNETDEFPTDERCHILELLDNHKEAPMSIARARVEPNVTTAWHRLLRTTETYYILSGHGLMYINEEVPFEVWPGHLVKIPADAAQRIQNLSKVDDLIFLAICTPSFTDMAYESLE